MQLRRDCRRIVIKIGSSLFYAQGRLEVDSLRGVAEEILTLWRQGREVLIVSSGAIAMGMEMLKLEARPKDLSFLQAAAAVGQHELMDIYRRNLKETGLSCAQVLLTCEDFDDRSRYLNAKNTLATLLKLKSVPIINENDTVSTDEIKFGDNDRLSAMVASLINADLLIILSDVDGLLDYDKKTVISLIEKITPQIRGLACPTNKKTSVGGMVTKVEAARIAVDSGIPCVIANGRKKGAIIENTIKPGSLGTLFLPKKESLTAKRRWLAFSAKPKGSIIVDGGAKSALLNKKSLLSVGVVDLSGKFSCGDIVSVTDLEKDEFARGLSAISSQELLKVKGTRFKKEIIHRDNIVITKATADS